MHLSAAIVQDRDRVVRQVPVFGGRTELSTLQTENLDVHALGFGLAV